MKEDIFNPHLPIVELVTQTLPLNCVSACLAMILNKPIDVVTNEFHEGYINIEIDPHEYLDGQGIRYTRLLAGQRNLEPGKLYMLSTPSVNIMGGMHAILVQVTQDGRWFLWDPNEGRAGRIVVGSFGDEEPPTGYAQLKSYIPEYEFDVRDVKAFHLGFKDHA